VSHVFYIIFTLISSIHVSMGDDDNCAKLGRFGVRDLKKVSIERMSYKRYKRQVVSSTAG